MFNDDVRCRTSTAFWVYQFSGHRALYVALLAIGHNVTSMYLLKRAHGRGDAQLMKDVQERSRTLALSDNELASVAYLPWLQSNSVT